VRVQGGGAALAGVGKGSGSFFEKRTALMARASGQNRDSAIKVFCFFSSEKKALLAY
jgi:hypothetical protein